MPMRCEIDSAAGLVRMYGSGVLTDDEMIDCIKRLRANPDLRPGMPTLSDMRGVERLAVTAEGLRAMLAAMKSTDARRGPAKAAIVTNTAERFGVARMLAALAESSDAQPTFRAFHDMAEALEWLGLPAE